MHAAILSLLLATAQPPAAVIADPPADAAHPAAMAAFTIPSHGAVMNAVMYTASGVGPHPTLLLLHGFPGNEQNLDLAQAARRAGWNVLTLHYRGSWGSTGSFSFLHCAEDADSAMAFLRMPDTIVRFAIDPKRIAVAGHSLGGMTAARAAADDPKALGAFLIDPADLEGMGHRFLTDAKARQDFLVNEVRGDMPPLAGTSEETIMTELEHAGPELSLTGAMPALAGRPLAMIFAERGLGGQKPRLEAAARAAGAKALDVDLLATDHSFSDKRIALASRLVTWLAQFQAPAQ